MRFEHILNIDIFGKSSSQKLDILATIFNCSIAILPIINKYISFFIAGFCFFSMDIIFSHRQMPFCSSTDRTLHASNLKFKYSRQSRYFDSSQNSRDNIVNGKCLHVNPLSFPERHIRHQLLRCTSNEISQVFPPFLYYYTWSMCRILRSALGICSACGR